MVTLWRALKIVGCVALLCFVIPVRKKSTEDEFEAYLKRFNKLYRDEGHRHGKLEAFRGSLTLIETLNARRTNDESARYGLTKFSDLTPEEFKSAHLTSPKNGILLAKLLKPKTQKPPDVWDIPDVPSKIDWRTKNAVTKVKDQKTCGACWAFSVIESVESVNAIKGNELVEFSVQEMIDCAGNGNEGCVGGDVCSLLHWLNLTQTSIVRESEYPLNLKTEGCGLKTDSAGVGVRVKNFTCRSHLIDEGAILKLLADVGPVAVAVNALSWQNYVGGVIQYHCDGGANLLNHAVQIVGYDLDADIPHYIVRNSWGEDFGDKGYLYIAIGKNLCGLATEVAVVTL